MSLLTDTFIRSIKLSSEKNEAAYCDGNGLYLIVRNSLKSKDHLKSWKLKYKRNNKLKSLQLGKYPEITLKRARSLVANYKELLANGEDPQSHNIKQKNKIRDAYNHAEYLEERTSMMQIWADYLDQLKHGGNITPIEQQKQEA